MFLSVSQGPTKLMQENVPAVNSSVRIWKWVIGKQDRLNWLRGSEYAVCNHIRHLLHFVWTAARSGRRNLLHWSQESAQKENWFGIEFVFFLNIQMHHQCLEFKINSICFYRLLS